MTEKRRWTWLVVMVVVLVAFTGWIFLPFHLGGSAVVIKPADGGPGPVVPATGADLTNCPLSDERTMLTAPPGCYQVDASLSCEGPLIAIASHWNDDGGKLECSTEGWHRLGWGVAGLATVLVVGLTVLVLSRARRRASLVDR
jgi:hypothetical protein